MLPANTNQFSTILILILYNLPRCDLQAKELAKAIAAGKGSSKAQVAICAPHPFLAAVKDDLVSGGVELGAQACYFEQAGAFTGATSVIISCDAVVRSRHGRYSCEAVWKPCLTGERAMGLLTSLMPCRLR